MPTVNFEFKGTVRNLHIEELYDVSAEKNIDVSNLSNDELQGLLNEGRYELVNSLSEILGEHHNLSYDITNMKTPIVDISSYPGK